MILSIETILADVPTIRAHKMSVATMTVANAGAGAHTLCRRHRGLGRGHHHRRPQLRRRKPGEYQDQYRHAYRSPAGWHGSDGGGQGHGEAAQGHPGQPLRQMRDRDGPAGCAGPAPGRAAERTAGRPGARRPACGLDPGQWRHGAGYRRSAAHAGTAPPPHLQAEDRLAQRGRRRIACAGHQARPGRRAPACGSTSTRPGANSMPCAASPRCRTAAWT